MRLNLRSKPSPAMVVAVVALSLGLVGSAVAGTGILSKSQVKKVASKQITKRAPGLSVASAKNAADADRLDGIDSVSLTPAAAVGRTNPVTLTTSDQTVLSVTIPTETSMGLVASASTKLQGNGGDNDVAICALWVDGDKNAVDYSTTIADTVFDSGALSAVGLDAVPAGTHTVELRCREGNAPGNDVTLESAGMTVTGHLYPSS